MVDKNVKQIVYICWLKIILPMLATLSTFGSFLDSFFFSSMVRPLFPFTAIDEDEPRGSTVVDVVEYLLPMINRDVLFCIAGVLS